MFALANDRCFRLDPEATRRERLIPRRSKTLWNRCARSWPGDAPPLRDLIEQFPLGEASLLHLISVSSICAARLVRHPEILLWLCQPEICSDAPQPTREMLADLQAIAKATSISAENFRALRFWKGREMLRIALREVAEVAPLEETTLELSLLAEICLREVYQHWNTELRSRRGGPDDGISRFSGWENSAAGS